MIVSLCSMYGGIEKQERRLALCYSKFHAYAIIRQTILYIIFIYIKLILLNISRINSADEIIPE